MSSRRAWTAFVLALAVTVNACGGGSPVAPPPPPPPPPPPANAAPVIVSVTADVTRIELSDEVTVTAVVTDAETSPDQLRYEWTATGGTFEGSGASVRWKPPADRPTPENYPLTLTVVEQYGTANAQGVRPENRVTAASAPVRVHNSRKEVDDMAVRFLTLFADFSKSPDACLAEFSDSCNGKAAERADIVYNREYVQIQGAQLRATGANLVSRFDFAESFVNCTFESIVTKCDPADALSPCAPGMRERASGICYLTARYEQDRWWLCSSQFFGNRERFVNGVIRRLIGPGAYGR